METLIYFYLTTHTTDPLTPCVKAYDRKEYRLVRIGLSREAAAVIEGEKGLEEKNQEDPKTARIRKIFRRWKFRKEKPQDGRYLILREIQKYWGDELTTYCICAQGITYFNRWRFSEYREAVWIERLLAEQDPASAEELPHFLVLGYSYSLREILFHHARRLKSLKICARDDNERDVEEIRNIADDLYDEYGLTAEVRILSGKENFGSLRSLMAVKCRVLDFSGETYFHPHIVPEGSVWYDVDAMEQKRRNLAERTDGIAYKSLTVP